MTSEKTKGNPSVKKILIDPFPVTCSCRNDCQFVMQVLFLVEPEALTLSLYQIYVNAAGLGSCLTVKS